MPEDGLLLILKKCFRTQPAVYKLSYIHFIIMFYFQLLTSAIVRKLDWVAWGVIQAAKTGVKIAFKCLPTWVRYSPRFCWSGSVLPQWWCNWLYADKLDQFALVVSGFWQDSPSSCLTVLWVQTNFSVGSKALLNRAWHSRNTPTLHAQALRPQFRHENKTRQKIYTLCRGS